MRTLQRYRQDWNILVLLKQGDAKGNLLHNKNNRYSKNNIPVEERDNLYTNIENLKIPQDTIKLPSPVLFTGNVENCKHYVLTWLQSKRRNPCNRSDTYLSEWNLQFINEAEPFPQNFMIVIRENYSDVFNEKRCFHLTNLCCTLV